MRNKVLDQSRLLAAFLVIVIHSPFPGVIGQLIESFARVSVPFFFMISGYYSWEKSLDQIRRKIQRTGILLVWSVALYFLWAIVTSFYYGTTIQKLRDFFSLQTMYETFVLNTGVLLGHLWFILALLYCYLLYTYCLRKVSYGLKLAISIFLVVAFFVIREVLHANGVTDPIYYIRNFLFVGLPFFLMGEMVAQKRCWLSKVSVSVWVVTAIVGVVAAAVERLSVGCYDLYFGTVFASISFFVLSQSGKEWAYDRLSLWGKKYAGDIYVFHAIIITICNIAGSILGVLQNPVFLCIRPFAVLAICIAVISVKEKAMLGIARKIRGGKRP